MSAHACKEGNDGRALAVAHCFLSAYWDLGQDITVLFDTVIKESEISDAEWKKRWTNKNNTDE